MATDAGSQVARHSFALSEAQEGLWYFQILDPANPILNVGQYLTLEGDIDPEVLLEAMRRTIAEAEALHLRFAPDPSGSAVQWLEPGQITPGFEDLSALADPEAEALARMRADADQPQDLTHAPAAAFTLFQLSARRFFLYERMHHLVVDGYGVVLVTNRIGEHYGHLTGAMAQPLPFPPLTRAADEDAAYRGSERRGLDRDFWRAQMADLGEITSPTAQQSGGRAVSGPSFLRESLWLEPALLARLDGFAKTEKLGWPDVLTGLVGAYLARWSGEAGEAVIGVPFMARMGRKIARLPCMAMNVLPARIRPDEHAPLGQWLGQVAGDLRGARKHGLYRSEQLRRDLGRVGGARRLFGPLVNVQPFDRPPVFAGLDVGLHILGAGAVDDLTFTFRGDPETGMLFEVDANPALYTREEIRAHLLRVNDFIATALTAERLAEVATASALEIADQEALAAASWHPLPETTLVEMIAQQTAATPDAPALRYGAACLSFAALDARATALAEALVAKGAGPETLVAVALERGLDLPIALLAILKAGAAYLPLDPEHPPERLARILELSKPVVLITSADLVDCFSGPLVPYLPQEWPQAPTGQPALPLAGPDTLAYVIYTSGSTGEPKGVMIEHRAIVNRLWWMREHYAIGAGDRILQKTPATFDVSVWEFFLPMLSGAELVMAPPGAHRDPSALAALIRAAGITTLHFVPSMLSAFLAAPASEGLSIARTFCSGEELTADQRQRFHGRIHGALHNLYGPTEAAVDVSYWPAPAEDESNPLPIGYPVWNTGLVILDDLMRPVPAGLAGHLYLSGVQLARGYLGRPDLTEARFIADPRRPGRRLYATGDLARARTDGAVVYLGRSDHQVKIRGLRIELGEIESAIMATGLARECVVLAREDHVGEKRLVSYLVATEAYGAGALGAALAQSLPSYMVPAAEVVLAALPVTSNGKLDRKALPAPAFSASGRAAEGRFEELLARLYAEVLHLPEPARAEADFFSLGGDSLSAVRLGLRIQEELGRDPGLGAIFEQPVLAHLAKLIAQGGAQINGTQALITLAEGAPGAPPLFLIHPAGGLAWGYRAPAHQIAPARRVYGLQNPGLDPHIPLTDSLGTLAGHYADLILDALAQGQYAQKRVHLAGWSVGGILAQDIAAQLSARGDVQLGMVAVLDSYPSDAWRDEPQPDPVTALRALLAIAGHDPEAHPELDSRAKVVGFLKAGDTALGQLPEVLLDGVVRVVTHTNSLVRSHLHQAYPGALLHFRAAADHHGTGLAPQMWQPYVGAIEVVDLPLRHAEMTAPAAIAEIAPVLRAQMASRDAG